MRQRERKRSLISLNSSTSQIFKIICELVSKLNGVNRIRQDKQIKDYYPLGSLITFMKHPDKSFNINYINAFTLIEITCYV